MTLTDLTPERLAELEPDLSDGCIREPTPDDLTEPRGLWHGRAGAVLAPRDTEEVARIVRFAAAHRIPVVPKGGGTGLVGGQVRETGAPLVLSFERMCAIRGVWSQENVLIAEAGAILADVQAAAREAGRIFPLSWAAEGSVRLGGALATNAGGMNVVRYGMARDLVLGIEAVMADGSIHHGLKRLRKDNTGYDLRHLLIGSEGTLGLITAAALKLHPIPAETATALFVVPSPAAAIDLFARAFEKGGLTSFELISGMGIEFLSEAGIPFRQPFEAVPDWCVLVEVGLSAGGDPGAVLEDLFEDGLEADLATNGVIAASEAQRQELWHIRESVPDANRRIGAIASNDISLPISEIPGFIEACGARLRESADLRVNVFGHVGDGNLHYNLFPRAGAGPEVYDAERLRGIVTEEVMARGGSFSAEHGIGRLKVATLEEYGDPAKLAAMRAVKGALDPFGILNPGVMLRAEGDR